MTAYIAPSIRLTRDCRHSKICRAPFMKYSGYKARTPRAHTCGPRWHASCSSVGRRWHTSLPCQAWNPCWCAAMLGSRGDALGSDPHEGAAVTFNEVLSQTIAILHQHGRVSYRALKRQFAIPDDYLAD